MHHFFVDPSSIEEGIVRIVGTDLNHMKNVLRMKPGEEVLIEEVPDKGFNVCRMRCAECGELYGEEYLRPREN